MPTQGRRLAWLIPLISLSAAQAGAADRFDWPSFAKRPDAWYRGSEGRAVVAQIDAERRNGYAWYGTWGKKVADRFPRWKLEQTSTPRRPGP